MGHIWEFLKSVSVRFGSQNVLKLILKSQIFVPFGANLTQFGANSSIPGLISLLSWRWGDHCCVALFYDCITWTRDDKIRNPSIKSSCLSKKFTYANRAINWQDRGLICTRHVPQISPTLVNLYLNPWSIKQNGYLRNCGTVNIGERLSCTTVKGNLSCLNHWLFPS